MGCKPLVRSDWGNRGISLRDSTTAIAMETGSLNRHATGRRFSGRIQVAFDGLGVGRGVVAVLVPVASNRFSVLAITRRRMEIGFGFFEELAAEPTTEASGVEMTERADALRC